MRVAGSTMFFPRGGSSQVLRYLAPSLASLGVDYELTAGTTSRLAQADAHEFYDEVLTHPIDYDSAFDAHADGEDPMLCGVPIHPSYEDKTDVPDRFFRRVDEVALDHLETFWAGHFASHGFDSADVVHLNHLTPMQGAMSRAFGAERPPVVSTMHGTEVKFWQTLTDRSVDGRFPEGSASLWAAKMSDYAALSDRIVAISSSDKRSLMDLGVSESKIVHIPHGVDAERFKPRSVTPEEDAAMWDLLLSQECRATTPTGGAGSLAYSAAQLAKGGLDGTRDRVRLLWLGRFLHQKRLDNLLRAVRSLVDAGLDPVLIIWGGFPGEFDGEHPAELCSSLGLTDHVYFVGWRGHDDLASALPLVDALVVPSVNESFGLMYLEAMACGLPVVATSTGGPVDFVEVSGADANGWLVPPDDHEALVASLTTVVTDHVERRRRGQNALQAATQRFAWPAVAAKYHTLFESLHSERAQ